jgi:Peptidase M10 serralysin C terminal
MPTYPSIWTDQQIANQLTRGGQHWSQTTVTYSFNTNSTAGNALNTTFQSWVNIAIQTIEEMVGFNLIQVATGGTVTINGSRGDGTYAYGSWNVPANNFTSGQIFFDQAWDTNQSWSLSYGSYGLLTIMHELLHGLGLQHPGNYDGVGNYFPDALFLQDTHRYSIMSYFNADSDGSGTSHWFKEGGVWERQYAQTPMVYDLLALTDGGFNGSFSGYSPNLTTRAGGTTYGYNATAGINAVYNFASNPAPVLTIYDAGGIDTLDLSGDAVTTRRTISYDVSGDPVTADGARTTSVIDLRPGQYSSTHGMSNNIGIAFGTVIENAVGTNFSDSMIGNDVGNIISGGSGNDSLYAGSGGDFLLGGTGTDSLYGGAATDWFAFVNGAAEGDVIQDYANEFVYLGGSSAAPVFLLSGTTVFVNGITLTGAATGVVTAVTQASTALLSPSNLAAIQSVVTSGAYALGAFGAYTFYSFDAGGSQIWRTFEEAYTSSSALDYTMTLYDAGRAHYALNSDYDQAGAQSWSKIDTYYASASLVDSYFLLFDAGQGFYGYNSDNDQAGNQSWTQINSYFATASLLDTYFVLFDAGQGYYGYNSDYDQAGNQAWSVINTYMATASAIDTYYVAFDAGQPYFAINSDYDQASNQTWSTVNTYYSADSVIDYYRVTFDAGQAYYSFDINYDQAANQTWSSIATYYSAPGIIDSETTYYDTGQPLHSRFVDYDQGNAYAWNQHIVEYDTANHILNDYYI